ncbi:MAG: serine/threonine protein kinase, partial [Deltaproteobacteria bacterium]|nr:serine/threonine protein kinase [Deltaproteobacteria bacterium]
MPILTPEERVGTTLAGKYRLDRILATGGMATVFAGTHAWTEREVAVKILNYEHARDPEVVRRFLQEARAAAQLKHPNIVDVLDMGQDDDGTVFLVLELLHGETLKARFKRGPVQLHELGPLLAPILRAVASAHGKGVVHRDLKPDNIFLAIEPHAEVDHDPVPKLLDFGIAKVANEGDSGSTRTGTMVGTPQYMAPEQVRGDREVGPRADVWSMGVLLHYALTRKMPFNAETAPAVLARVLTERAKPIRTISPSVPDALAGIVDRALQHDPLLRFADMREMATAFESALGSLGVGMPASAPREASRLYMAGMAGVSGGFSVPPVASIAAVDDGPINPTPTAIVAPAPIPAPILASAALPSEYPPSPTTPYAWGAAPPPAEAAPVRRSLAPLLAAGAAVVMLLGGVTFWVVLGPMGGTDSSGGGAQPLRGATVPATTTTQVPAQPVIVPTPTEVLPTTTALPATTTAVPASPTTPPAPIVTTAPATDPAPAETHVDPPEQSTRTRPEPTRTAPA